MKDPEVAYYVLSARDQTFNSACPYHLFDRTGVWLGTQDLEYVERRNIPSQTEWLGKCLERKKQLDDLPQTAPPTGLGVFVDKEVKSKIRTFASGANRNSSTNKLDYDGFLSPLVLERYAQYLHKNRKLEDGTLRDSDNWQKGIPITEYLKSLWRHFFDVWKQLRGYKSAEDLEDSLCAVLFNASGILHERLKVEHDGRRSK